jgi:uracil-DNA glycosylase family 4
MSAYQQLLTFDKESGFVPVKVKKKNQPKSEKERGCKFCPLDKVEGVNKVKNLDKITGKSIMLWAQNPGYEENWHRKELIGPAGKFLWKHAAEVGLKREDCDIQNVVRCWTVHVEDGEAIVHNPTKEEIHCCSLYSEEALKRNAGKAKVHIVLGQVAAKALLKGEYRKGQTTFFSSKLKAWVILTFHPSYFLRGAPRSKLVSFRGALQTAVIKAKGGRGKYRYIKERDYKSVPASGLEELEAAILEAAKKGIRIAVDIEDGTDEYGNNVIVYVGFSWQRGVARGVFLCHKELRKDEEARNRKVALLRRIFGNRKIRKVFHHGVYDIWKLYKLLGIRVRGYDHDTEYSEYLRFSWAKAYGLAAIADRRFRLFAGYKSILDEFKNDKGLVNFYTVPKEIVILYNGSDSDLTKRIESSNDGKVNEPLLRAMIQIAKPLARMETNGPIFDWEHSKLLDSWLPKKIETIKKQLRSEPGAKHLNPNTPKEVAAIVYDRLKLGKHLDEEWRKDKPRSTDKETMQLLGRVHKFPNLVLEYRKLAKKKSTYMDAYRISAKLFGGRLRTKWWLTGTVTCRLRSGGDLAKELGIVNLQNIHGDPTIENLLVSDLSWREMYDDWKHRA